MAGRFWIRPLSRGVEVCDKHCWFLTFFPSDLLPNITITFSLLILGVFCCGPAPVKAIRDQRINLLYDIPFVYAEVNADVHTIIVSQGRVVSRSIDTQRVGSLICTKAAGFPRLQNITGDYKYIRSMIQTH